MITHYYRTLKDDSLRTYDKSRQGVWTHVVGPTEDELAEVIDEYGLDEAIVADINDFFEMPRFERSGSASYFFTRYPFDEESQYLETAPILIVIGESFIVTIVNRKAAFLEPFIGGKKELHTTQKTKTFLEFMFALTSAYERELTLMRKVVYRDRTKVTNIKTDDIQLLVSYEQELNDMIAAVVPTNTWIKRLAAGNYIQMYNEDVELVEDLMIANDQLVESAKAVLKTIQNIRTATEAILTQKLNKTIKLLTALTIILTIPTLVSSMYGMNVKLPLADHPSAFWLVLVLILTLVALTAHFFFSKKWF